MLADLSRNGHEVLVASGFRIECICPGSAHRRVHLIERYGLRRRQQHAFELRQGRSYRNNTDAIAVFDYELELIPCVQVELVAYGFGNGDLPFGCNCGLHIPYL